MTRGRILAWGAALFLLGANAVMQVNAGAAGDKDWLLLAARLWLMGRKIGVDIFEVNPPLIIWLYAIPVWISLRVPGLADFEALVLLGLGCVAFSTWLGSRLIAMHPAFRCDTRRQADFALLLVATLLFFSTQIYFFDRDHIMFVLIFPYMLRFMPSLAHQKLSLGLRVMIALFAAVGFCIKPYTLVIFAVLQLLYMVRERSWAILGSLENLIIYAGGALYLLCVWYFAPDYIQVIMPMAVETYSGFSRKINGYLFLSAALISAGLTFVDFRPGFATPYRSDAYYFMGVCVAFLAYALMNNGWGYTYNPLLCMLLFVSGWMLWEYSWLKRAHETQGLPAKQFLFGQRGCIANLAFNSAYMIACIAVFFFTDSCDKYDRCEQIGPYVDYVKDNHIHSFSTLALNLRRWSSLVRLTGAEWDTRFNHLWMLPKLMQEGEPIPAAHQWIVDYVGRAYAEDLERWKPEIVFVDTSDGIFDYPHPVDMPAFFSRVPAFKEAWRQYRYISTLDNCEKTRDASKPQFKGIDCRFAIYSRTAP